VTVVHHGEGDVMISCWGAGELLLMIVGGLIIYFALLIAGT
jgi:hypothetical protein